MRLLNTTKRTLEEFGGDKIPPYAIFSHTWGENEITFHDIEGVGVGEENKMEYEKVRNTCSMAAAHPFDYVWIDTCCIDKTSSAELSEAINSMYYWYQESEECYAYLADVPSNAVDRQTGTIRPEFSKSRWFTRGWTLQELIAPSTVIFLDQEWQEIGTKSSLQEEISKITGIPATILLGGNLECASVAQRMSWASKRETTRVEDSAYCLMGIFGVNTSMLYGERERAFIRLQEEIMKFSDDHSLFAWESFDDRGGLLATSPTAFLGSSEIIPFKPSSTLSGVITVNNKGIHFTVRFKDGMPFQGVGLAILPCTTKGEDVGIYVTAMSETNEYFMRTSGRLKQLNLEDLSSRAKIICVQQGRPTRKGRLLLPKPASYGHEANSKHIYSYQTPLSYAAGYGQEAVVRLLLDRADIEVNSKDARNRTPLLYAVGYGHEAVVRLLLTQANVEVNLKYEDGQTPLSWAAQKGHEAVIRLLLARADIEVNSKDRWSLTPLSYAVSYDHERVFRLLRSHNSQSS